MMKQRGKRLVSALILMLMLMAVGTAPVTAAAEGISVTVEASKYTVYEGEEINFTVRIGAVNAAAPLAGFTFALDLPDGMVLETSTTGIKPAIHPDFLGKVSFWTPAFDVLSEGGTIKHLFSAVYFEDTEDSRDAAPYTGAGTQIASFTCVASRAGSFSVSIKEVGFYSDPAMTVLASVSNVTPAVVTVQTPVGSNVTGNLKSYSPDNRVLFELIQSGDTVRSATIAATAGSGQESQDFQIAGVAAGTYTLKVTKPGHLSYTKTSVVVGAGPIDLGEITLIPGNANGDEIINSLDLSLLIAEYGRSGDRIRNENVDFNGDGIINSLDLSLLIAGYGRTAVVVP